MSEVACLNAKHCVDTFFYDGSRVCEHNPGVQVACVLCGSLDDSMFSSHL